MTREELEGYGFEYKKDIDLYFRLVVLDRHPYDPTIFKVGSIKIYGKDAKILTKEQLEFIWDFAAEREFKCWNGYRFTNRDN